MKQHKWHKEIKAWADGAEIEYQDEFGEWELWKNVNSPSWLEIDEYRIKPQPKEPQYLYVYQSYEETTFGDIKIISQKRSPINATCIGKIKLEVEDD